MRGQSIDWIREQFDEHKIDELWVDCFGTLLHRSVPSARVREIASTDLVAALRSDAEVAEIVRTRHRLERELSRKLSSSDVARDHRAPDLALALRESWPIAGDALPDQAAFGELFCAIEVAVESAVTELNPAIAELLRDLSRGTPVAVVSDTNLTGTMVRSILEVHGIADAVCEVVTSADFGETKRSGLLFRGLLESRDVSPSRVVMIGDNQQSDGEQAARHGLTPVIVSSGRWDAVKDAPAKRIDSHAASRLEEALGGGRSDVFPEMALTLWLFISRLHRALDERGARRPVFLAREGQFLRRLFDAAQPSLPATRTSPSTSEYLLTSRRSTLLPALEHPARLLSPLIEDGALPTVGDLASLLSVPAASTGLEPGAELSSGLLNQLFERSDFSGAVAQRRAEQRDLLADLVSSVVESGDELHTVDVGWKGTVRDHLATALPELRAHAHLMGLVVHDRTDLDVRTGHLFSNRPTRSPYYQVFSHFRELYELLLGADHGTVAGYERNANGTVGVLFAENSEEKRCHDELIQPWQRECLERFLAVSHVLAGVRDEPAWLTRATARHHSRMMYAPRESELEFVDRLVQFHNFGRSTVRAVGGASTSKARRSPRQYVSGGGWPPLRMRRGGADWQRRPYALVKAWQFRRGRLC